MRTLLLVSVLLAGCAQTTVTVCPSMPEYSESFTKKFTDQYESVTPGSELDIFIIDARALRNQVRECLRKQQ